MVSVCLPSDALLQHLLSYLAFSYLGHGVSLQGCSSKVQPLLLTLGRGVSPHPTPPDLERGVAPLGPPAPAQPLTAPWTWDSSSPPFLRCRSLALSAAAPDLGRGVAPLSRA